MNASRTASTKDTFWTPSWIMDIVREYGDIALDPATDPRNPTAARKICIAPGVSSIRGEEHGVYDDGLKQDWMTLSDRGLIWINPPFDRKKEFLCKAASEFQRGATIMALVPCDPSARWFQALCSPRLSVAQAVAHLSKRPTFIDPDTGMPPLGENGKPTSAMFGCSIVYWGEDVERFRDVWAMHADVDTDGR